MAPMLRINRCKAYKPPRIIGGFLLVVNETRPYDRILDEAILK